MAERRMFAKTIVLSDAFLDMPMSARCLYFTLGMLADDDGFVNSPKSIMRQCGASNDDLKILLTKKFIIGFETGVIVIKHWRINNYLRNDRYVETKYVDEKKKITADESGTYHMNEAIGIPVGIPHVDGRYTEDSIGKDSIGKNTFIPPTVEDIADYCLERKNNVDPGTFYDFYQSKGWMVGRNKMKDWKACVRTWEKNRKDDKSIGKGDTERTDYNTMVYAELLEDMNNG